MPLNYHEILKSVREERLRVDKEKGKPPRAMSAAGRERLVALLVEYLSQFSRVEDRPGGGVQFRVDTFVGPLVVHYDLWFGTIFSRFEEPDRARIVPNTNPYSGKWNFHFGKNDSPDEAFQLFKSNLESVRTG
jgi:hypothetical protein